MKQLPVVLTRAEVRRLLARLEGTPRLLGHGYLATTMVYTLVLIGVGSG